MIIVWRGSQSRLKGRNPAGRVALDAHYLFRKAGLNRQAGSAIAEFAIVFPLFVLILLFIGAVTWTFWVQAATAIASQEAARAAAYRQGEGYNPAAGYKPFSDALAGITNPASAERIGSPEIRVDFARRSLLVSVERPLSFYTPALSAEAAIRAGTFTRLMQFFGGPPDPWE
jgi:hypothetical protein